MKMEGGSFVTVEVASLVKVKGGSFVTEGGSLVKVEGVAL